jgi:hypothetical protein
MFLRGRRVHQELHFGIKYGVKDFTWYYSVTAEYYCVVPTGKA